MSAVLILGPQGSGKGHLNNVLCASPDLPQPGSVSQQTAPTKRLRTAGRYILVRRARAVDSIHRHNWRTMTRLDAEARVAAAWAQIEEHTAGSDRVEVDYRDLVERQPEVIARLADWLGIDPWGYDGPVYDGDEDFDG